MFWRRRRIEPIQVGGEIDDTCAVLTMIARFHGRDVDPTEVLHFLEQVAEEPELDRSAGDLIQAAAELGLSASGVQVEHPLGFAQLTYPCVGHIIATATRGPAFVVLAALSGQQLAIVDPYTATRASESIEVFFQRSSGIVIVFELGQQLPPAVLRR